MGDVVFFFCAKYVYNKEIVIMFGQACSRMLPLNDSAYFIPSS